MKKPVPQVRHRLIFVLFPVFPGLFWMNGLDRAYIGAGPAIGAFLGIDHVDISFGNGLFRTFVDTRITCRTFIIYNICHFELNLWYNNQSTKLVINSRDCGGKDII